MTETGRPDEMECKELIAMVTDYLDGVLPPEERARLEAHLDECDWCERYIEQTRQVAAAVGEIDDGAPDPDAWERALAAFREQRGGAPG